MEIIKVQYLEPYYKSKVGYFKGMSGLIWNFGTTLNELYDRVHNRLGITKEEFNNNMIQMINEHCDRIKVLEVIENV